MQRHIAELDGAVIRVLEVASGSGQHAAHCAAALPDAVWQPTDIDSGVFPSIRAWTAGLESVREPILVDASAPFFEWGVEPGSFDCLLAVNVTHISPWAATTGLFAGAARALRRGGLLMIYGPFHVAGEATAESNTAFDAMLRKRDVEWGIRDAVECRAEAAAAGLELAAADDMPSNNLFLVFRNAGEASCEGTVGRIPGTPSSS